MKKNKRTLVLNIISSLIVICTLISGSYAFYVIAVSEKVDIATTVEIPACASADLTGGTAISLSKETSVPISDLKALSSSNYRYSFTVKNNCSVTSNLVVSLAMSKDSTMPANALKYVLVEQGATLPVAGSYLNSGSSEKALTAQIKNEIKAKANVDVELGYELLNTTIAAGASKNYYLYLWVDYYEGDRTQSETNNNITMNTSFKGQLVISDYSEYSSSPQLASTIVSYAKSEDYTSSQDSTLYRIVNQNGYRYEGRNPDNYIMFNNELWRIIGAFDGSTIGLTSGKYYTKIMRNDSIAASTDTIYATDFINSKLKNYLNGTYYNGLNSASRGMIANAKWYLGAVGTNATSITASQYYAAERGTTPGYGVSTLNMTANVSVMYISDYGYATYSKKCDNNSISVYSNGTNGCCADNWIYKSGAFQYSMVPYSANAYIMRVQNDGTLFAEQWPNDPSSRSFRPTVYLNYSVKLVGGKGTIANPYVVSQ